MTCLRANNPSFDKLLCAIFMNSFYFQPRTSYIFPLVAILYVLVLLLRRNLIYLFTSQSGLLFRLESNILLGEFVIHVTYILNAITGNIDTGNIDANVLLLFMLSSLSSLRNHWNV